MYVLEGVRNRVHAEIYASCDYDKAVAEMRKSIRSLVYRAVRLYKVAGNTRTLLKFYERQPRSR